MDDYRKTVERRLKRFPAPEAKALGDWLQDKPVGINLALQILEQLDDLRKITGKSVSLLLGELLEEVNAKELHSKELGRRLRDAIDRRLHPERHAHERAFAAWAKRLGLPSGARIQPPQNFEGKLFTLQVDFDSPTALRVALESVAASLETRPEWAELGKF